MVGVLFCFIVVNRGSRKPSIDIVGCLELSGTVSRFRVMPYDLVLAVLTAAFPLIGCALFIMFWKLSRDDAHPDPIYESRTRKFLVSQTPPRSSV